MANIKSSLKQNRKRIKREARNRAQKSTMRTAVKKVRAAIEAKDKKAAAVALKSAISLIDKTVSKGTIKKGTGSRSVSRLQVAVAHMG